MSKRRKVRNAVLSMLLSAVLMAEPAMGSAIVYAAEPVGGQSESFSVTKSEKDGTDESGSKQGGSSESGSEQGGTGESGSEQGGSSESGSGQGGTGESGSEQGGTDEPGSGQGGTGESGNEQGGTDESGSEQGGTDESGNEQGETDEIGSEIDGSDELEDETDDIDEEIAETDDLEETEQDETLEDESETELEDEKKDEEDNWQGTGHKAPALEMELTSSMVAEKRALEGTAERLDVLQKDVQYSANEAVFLASSKNYADKVAKGYGASVETYEDGIAVMVFDDEVTDIIAMAEDEKVKLPAVYPNYIYTTCSEIEAYPIGESTDGDSVVTAFYSDPFLSTSSNGYQYYHDEIHSLEAWQYNNNAGKGIKVAVIDSGVNKNHADLKSRIASASVTYSTPYNKAEDNDGHGTHVSGIIAANINNKQGGAGIAYQSTIISIKALEENPVVGSAAGTTADIIKAVNSAAKSGARVINMSLGGNYYDPLFESAVNAATNKGIVVVAAAGNDGVQLSATPGSSNYYSPACFENVITVSAKQQGTASKADFSNYGSGIIDITAPGVNIASSVPGGYALMDGTSQAAPMVAAAAAYILSVSPDLTKNKTKATVETVKKILQDSATKTGYTNTSYFGQGLLNVEAAIKMAAPSSEDKGGDGALQAPAIEIAATTVANNQIIQNTDLIALSSLLGTASNDEVKIYYTLDGKTPTESSNLYTEPFRIEASGNKTIKAVAVYYGKKSSVTTVKVKVNAYVTGFAVTSKTGSNYLGAGKSLTLAAGSFEPSYATNKKVKWEITNGAEYATINSSGKLTAKTNFSEDTIITVKATASDKKEGAVSATIDITLLPKVTSLTLKNTADAKTKLEYPDTKKMEVIVAPADAEVAIAYTSSNTKVATVSADGTISSVGNGTATITAKTTDGSNKKVTMKVTVTKKVQNVTVTSKTGEYQLAAGKSLQLTASVTSDATNKKVKWEITSGSEYATINASGKLTAKSNSYVKDVSVVKVKAKALDGSEKSDEVSVTIYPSVTGKVALEGGTSCTLGTSAKGDLKTSVQLYPYTDNYLSTYFGRAKGSGTTGLGNFTYTSSNTKVATVNSTGLVTVKAAGTTKIKVAAKDGSGKSVTCTVKVIKPITSMSVYSKTGVTVVGRNKKLSLGALTNSDATNKKLQWSSADTSIATVDSKGVVKGISYGTDTQTTTITATATDGSGTSATFRVTVRPAITKLAFYTNKKTFATSVTATIPKGSCYQIGSCMPYYFDETSGNSVPRLNGEYAYWDGWKGTAYSCSNSNVIQIVTDKDGYLYICAVNKGKATITYKALDGSGKNCKITITVK